MPRNKQFCEKEVLNKAMELFWKKGFHATSMQDLVSHLGINRASLYDTFGGKDALYDRAFAHYRKTVEGWLQEVFNTEPLVREGFKKLFAHAVGEAVTDENRKGCFVVNTAMELIPGNEKIHHVLLENSERVESIFIAYVQNGIDSGELSPSKDAQEIGLMLFALYNGIRVVSKVDADQEKLQKMVSAALSVLD